MRGLRNRALVAAAGLAAALLLLEIVLRVVGMVHVRRTIEARPAPAAGAERLLCVGDSFTEGLGAEPHESYPTQLQQLLRRQTGRATLAVVNRGRAGLNSAQVLAQITAHLDTVRPSMLLLLAGAGNYWNLWGHGLSFEHQQQSSASLDLLYRVRVFRLVVLLSHELRGQQPQPYGRSDPRGFERQLWADIKNHNACAARSAWFYPITVPGRHHSQKQQQQYSNLLGQLGGRLARDPKNHNLLCARALLQCKMGAHRGATATLRRGLALAADRRKKSELHYLLGTLQAGVFADMARGGPGLQRAIEQALRWHREGLRTDPGNGLNYFGMGEIHVLQTARGEDLDPAFNRKMFQQARSWFKRGIAADPRHAAAGRTRARYLQQYIAGAAGEYAWIRSDLEQVIRICRQRKVQVVLQSYPNNSRNKSHIRRVLDNTNRAMAHLARRHDLLFVDHHARFGQLIRAGRYSEPQLYDEDVIHPNKLGYRVMAEELALQLSPRFVEP